MRDDRSRRVSLNHGQRSSLRGLLRLAAGLAIAALGLVAHHRGDLALDQLGSAAGLLDLLLRRRAERLRLHGELLRELARAEDLQTVVAALDQAALAERRHV